MHTRMYNECVKNQIIYLIFIKLTQYYEMDIFLRFIINE